MSGFSIRRPVSAALKMGIPEERSPQLKEPPKARKRIGYALLELACEYGPSINDCRAGFI
jgi:hypothetical protein